MGSCPLIKTFSFSKISIIKSINALTRAVRRKSGCVSNHNSEANSSTGDKIRLMRASGSPMYRSQ